MLPVTNSGESNNEKAEQYKGEREGESESERVYSTSRCTTTRTYNNIWSLSFCFPLNFRLPTLYTNKHIDRPQ